MNPQVLNELITKWEAQADDDGARDGGPDADRLNAEERGERRAKRQCAEELAMLVKLLARP